MSTNMIKVREKDFSIDFGQSFDLGGETKYDIFPIGRKRVYVSIIEKITDDLDFFFKVYPEFAEMYLTAVMNIREGQYEHSLDEDGKNVATEFIQGIADIIVRDEKLVQLIRDKVNSEYTITIETRSGEEELQFKDSYAKLVICISIMCRLVIPLLCVYMDTNDIKKEGNVTIDLFHTVFQMFNVDDTGVEVDLPVKITRFIGSQVTNTLYSDKVIWDYLKNISVNDNNMVLDLFKKIIRDTIPKLDINKSIVSFLHVVIKQQIMYQFTQNIKINFKPISQVRTDSNDSNVSPFTRVETRLVSANEMQYVIDKENIKNFIDRRRSKYSGDEIAHYMRHVQPNTLQIKLMTHYINSQDRIDVMLCNREEYMYLLLITRQWMLDHRYQTLAALLTSGLMAKGGRRNLKKGKLVTEVMSSKTYQNILAKYTLVREKIEENKSIINLIGDILTTEFSTIPTYKNNENLESYVAAMEDNPKPLISEILSFLERS